MREILRETEGPRDGWSHFGDGLEERLEKLRAKGHLEVFALELILLEDEMNLADCCPGKREAIGIVLEYFLAS
ncbi:hypothetical protein MUP65_02600 [Patescibacteria group bacterium]|nr:hypothetical protein [Patescibacteria group bacterium]